LFVVLLAAVGYEGFLRRHRRVRGSADRSLITVLAGVPTAAEAVACESQADNDGKIDPVIES
jgi:hypothetical protein